MNKKFTMVCASLLLASAFSVNAAESGEYAPDVKAMSYVATVSDADTQVKAINMADGVKFYLLSNGEYLTVTNKAVSEKAGSTKKVNVWTLGNSTTDIKEASVFEVRSFSKISSTAATFELYVDGKKVLVKSTEGGAVETADAIASKFLTTSLTTAFDDIVLYEINKVGKSFAGFVSKAYTSSLDYKAVDLKEFNATSTTFSFDFSDDELVGNLFKELVPVTISNSTYFVKGDKASEFNGTVATAKGLQLLAIDNKNNYSLNSSKPGEGLKLRMVDAEKFLKDATTPTDSLLLAGFTSILEADQLNNAEVLELTVSPSEKALGIDIDGDGTKTASLVDFNIAAVKTSATDTKAYVTTVAEESSWAVVKNAMLGANTYLAASEFLNKDAINTVSILVVNGTPGEKESNYYKYVTIGAKDGNTYPVTYSPASTLDFSLAHNQWVVSNFDGKYTLTLVNRLNGEELSLKLAKKENGYEVINGKLKSYDAEKEGTDKSINAIVKFLPVATTQTDGYLLLSEEQMKNGIKLSFSGKTDLAGEKEFFGVYPVIDGEVSYGTMVPSFEAANGVTLYAEEYTEDDKPVYAKSISYAYLDANGKVQTKTVEDNLVVPTYKFYIKNTKDELVNALNACNENGGFDIATPGVSEEKAEGATFAFAKNAAGNYSLVEVKGTDVKGIAADKVVAITYNKDNANANPDGLEFTTVARYDADDVNNVFANVNILPSVVLNESLPAIPGHYTFDNERGSISVKDLKGINEGFLASEGQVFWLDTADIEKATPSFYISFGKDSVAARNYMFNPIDSAKVFDEYTASYKYNAVYYYGEEAPENVTDEANHNLKVAYASTVAEEGKDLADAFKFNITLNDVAVADEYVLTSVKDNTLKVAQKNGVVILVKENNVDGIEPMVFTVNPAEAPTSNESVVASEVKVVANNGSVVVKNAAGKNVVVSTILGQVVANGVLTSDKATINVPAGIVVVAVDGESFKVNVK